MNKLKKYFPQILPAMFLIICAGCGSGYYR